MVLTNKFLEYGFIIEPNPNDNRPDICLLIDGQKVWIECCVPTRGDPLSPDYVPELPSDGRFHRVNPDANVLRCTSTLVQKREQHKKWLRKGTCSPNEPYIIALSGIHLDLRINKSTMPGIIRALYAMGDHYVTFDMHEHEYNDHQGSYKRQLEITKNNGSKVPTTFFINEVNKTVTGIVYSRDQIGCLSTSPDYCYVQNVNSVHRGNWGFDCFMQTYSYSLNQITIK